jgi:cytochrome c biogenesis protein CcmG, thiol:disulfide interchange protein DsbE
MSGASSTSAASSGANTPGGGTSPARRGAPWRFLLPLGAFFVLVAFLGVGLTLNPREVPSPLIGKPAPDFALPRLDDPAQVVRRDDLKGQVWLLNVWASWCVTCLEEHPALSDFARTAPVPIIGLNYKDDAAAGRAWLKRHGDPYRMSLVDAQGRTGIDFGVYGVPETYVIDRQGIVRFKHTGALTPQVFDERIRPLIAELSRG